VRLKSMLMNPPGSPHFIVVGIDGTGSSEWRKPDGSNSHVFQFVRDFQFGALGVDRKFYDGPRSKVWGTDSVPILQEALDFVRQRLQVLFPRMMQGHKPLDMFDVNSCMQQQQQQAYSHGFYTSTYTQEFRVPVRVTPQMLSSQPLSNQQVRVILVGHSRGGLIATVLARMLSPLIQVYFLGLYDSVDRQPCLDGEVVENVKYVFHARRHPQVGSRTYFSNTSTQYKAEYYEEKYFYTSHGGIGGSFVTDRTQVGMFDDGACVVQPPQRPVVTRGGVVMVDNTNPLTKKLGKPIDIICADGSAEADRFIREGARKFGLPVR
jgi:hypothetical protein